MDQFAIEMLGITKSFGSIVANNNITLRVKSNSIHGIIGENGAGKSTLMSVLFGLYQADSGVIKINGQEVFLKSPHDATKMRIGMVHQHFKLVGAYNAIDNIILGNEISRFGLLNRVKAKRMIKELATRYAFDVNLETPVYKLSVGQQQKIEILKTLFLDANILIFDEPTAVLTPQEIAGFLKLLQQFRDEGKTIVLITHKLEEIKAICEQATIIRHGVVVEHVEVKKTSTHELARLMVGSEVHEAKNTYQTALGKPILEVKAVSGKKLHQVSLKVHAGEIVAIAGVEGNGQSELVKVVTGLVKLHKGQIIFWHLKQPFVVKSWINQQFSGIIKRTRVTQDTNDSAPKELIATELKRKSIRQRIRLGMAHIPEDRQKHGLILDMKLKYSIGIKKLDLFARFGLMSERKISRDARQVIEKYDVRGANYGDSLARQLSGGNQQKAILGRELESDHSLLVVAQPTRGLDVGAIVNVHEQIIAEKEKGRAVLIVSYDLSEVMSLADRIVVLNSGRVIGELDARKASRQEIGLMMAGINPTAQTKGALNA